MGKIKFMNLQLTAHDHIQFTAQRITKGNPVTGTFVSEDETWITVKLTKYIEGLANAWDIGEEKTFRKSFLTNLKIIH